jgi:histidine triad (HIT) family protein
MKKVSDFYCDEVFSGKTKVKIVRETKNILAFYHTKPYYPVHIVVTPKKHISSILELEDKEIAIELIELIKSVASDINIKYGSCRVITNLGNYQDSKHLHFHIINGSHEDVK